MEDNWKTLAGLAAHLGHVTNMVLRSTPDSGGCTVEIELLLTGREMQTFLDHARWQEENVGLGKGAG